jgi:copper chaperone CopZ
MKSLLMIPAFVLLTAVNSVAQDKGEPQFASVDIHTNAVCNDCVKRIESDMIYEKGVQSVKVDLKKEIIHVEYKAKKTDPDKLRQAVSKIGYLADDVQPDSAARAALPDCCRMPKEEHDAQGDPVAPAPTVPQD